MRLTPAKAMRRHCLRCCCDQRQEVAQCPATQCSLHPFRFGRRPALGGGAVRWLKLIRAKCLDCSGESPEAVRNCEHTDCCLFPYRFGRRPARVQTTGREPHSAGPLRAGEPVQAPSLQAEGQGQPMRQPASEAATVGIDG